MSSEGTAPRTQSLGVARPPADVEDRRLMHDVAARLFGGTEQFRLARFEVERRLGAGASGVVYLAFDPQLERRVALKAIHRSVATGFEADALLREARAAARLDHRNVVTVYEVGEADDCVWIAMQLVEGPTLREWCAAEARGPSEVIALFADIADGLAAAHAAGLVHRDFKPENVLVSEEGGRPVPRVADFGLARELGGEVELGQGEELASDAPAGRLTRTGALAGTPRYMAPEQFRGGRVGPEADQFAFFVALYEALHGQRPFEGDTVLELEASARAGRVREGRRRLPGWLERLVRRGLSVEPGARWPDMTTVASRLRSGPRRLRRRLGLVGGVALVGFGGFAWQGLASSPVDPCQGVAADADRVWDEARRSEIMGRLEVTLGGEESVAPARVLAVLDRRVEDWKSARRGVCVDREERRRTEAGTQLRVDCLARVLAVTDGFVHELSASVASREDLSRVVERVEELPTVGRCEDDEVLARRVPVDASPEARRELEGLRDELDALEGALLVRYEGAAAEDAMELRERARSLAWPPLLARASLIVADSQWRRGEIEAAVASAEEALSAAVEGKDERIAARAALGVAWYEGEGRRDIEAARRWLQLADAHVKAAGEPARERITALEHGATFAQRSGGLEEAAEKLDRALELRATAPELQAGAWRTLSELGTVRFAAGELEAAAELFERSAREGAEVLGPDHPHVARPLSNLGVARQRLGDLEGARAALHRALEIKRRALGPQHLEVASTLVNLGSVESDAVAKVALYREAIAIVEAKLGPDSPQLANATFNLANALVDGGDAKGALEAYRRFTEIRRAQFGDTHADVVVGEVAQSAALRALGRTDEALEVSTRWVTALESAQPPALEAIDRAEVYAQHARSLLAAGRPRDAADIAAVVVETCKGSEYPDCIPEDVAKLAADPDAGG